MTIHYSMDNINWTAYTEMLDVTENATYYFRATDAVGNIGTAQITFGNIDTTAPVIILNGNNTAPAQSATLTAKTDDGSAIYYSMDNTTWAPYENPLDVTENETYYFKATDVAGNVGTNSITFTNIDSTAPVIEISISGWSRESVTVSAEVTDSQSGVDKTYYTCSGTQWTEFKGSFRLTQNGPFMVRVVDKNGNETLSKVLNITNIIQSQSASGALAGEELESWDLASAAGSIVLALESESAADILAGELTSWNTPSLESCVCDADLKKFGNGNALNGLLATA